MQKITLSLFMFLVFGMALNGQNKTLEMPKIGDSLFFKLLGTNGKYLSLDDYNEAKGLIIIFTCNHCPFAKLYPKRLNALHESYKKKGVPLIAISSTDSVQYEEDDYAHMVNYAKKEKFKFPYLYDKDQSVAKHFKAQKTPHAFVIWRTGAKWQIAYEGAIDDNGMHANEVQQAFVANAVDALLAGKMVQNAHTKSVGCQIYFR